MATAATQSVLQGFRAVVVAAMGVSPTLALTVTGGARQFTISVSLGTAALTTIKGM